MESGALACRSILAELQSRNIYLFFSHSQISQMYTLDLLSKQPDLLSDHSKKQINISTLYPLSYSRTSTAGVMIWALMVWPL